MMNKQMKLFEEGGLNQEGGMIDAESGNEVPVGSTREEVRDDIPAKLSEGEFVMPADVVRYHGLDKMMALRDEAKMGLSKMEAMGQMGNSDEATLPDDLPFGMADLIVVADDGKEVEMAEGGYVTMANGGDPSASVRQLGPTYTPPTNTIPVNYKKVMEDTGLSFKEYRNAEGNTLLVSFIGGKPIYPIPEGYSEYTPVTGEPISPVQEVVQANPTPPLPDVNEERDGPSYIDGYTLDMATATTEQLENELRKQTSGIGKLASGIAFALGGPLVAGLYETGKSASANNLAVEIQRRLDSGLIPPNKVQALTAQLAEMKKNVGFGLAPNLANLGRKAAEVLGIDLTKDNALTKVLNSFKNDPSGETGQKIHNDLKTSAAPRRPMTASEAAAIERQRQFLQREARDPERYISNPSDRRLIEQMRNRQLELNLGPMGGVSSALRGGFDASSQARADGTLPSGVQVAGNVSNEQLRQFNQNYMTAGDRYAMGYGGRGLQGTRPEGFGSQDLGYTPPADPTVDPRGPSQIPATRTPFPVVDKREESFATPQLPVTLPDTNRREQSLSMTTPTPYYDAFGNTTVFTGSGPSRVDTGIPLGSDAAPGFLAYGDRNVQDELDAAQSTFANVSRIPYTDPGAYTFAPPFGMQDAMGQFPASAVSTPVQTQGGKVIPTLPVGTRTTPNVSGTIGRQNIYTRDIFPPVSGGIRDEIVTDAGDSIYGSDVKVERKFDPRTTAPAIAQRGLAGMQEAGVDNIYRDQPLKFPSEMDSILQSGAEQIPYDASFDSRKAMGVMGTPSQLDSERMKRINEPMSDTTLPVDTFKTPLESQLDTNRMMNINQIPALLPSQRDADRMIGINEPLSTLPSQRDADRMIGINEPLTTASQADARRMIELNQPLSSGVLPDVDEVTDTKVSTPAVAAQAATVQATPYEKSFGAGAQIITGIPLAENQVFDVRDSKQRAAANKALNIATSPGTAGTGPRAHILSSGRKVPINSAVAQYDREQVDSGYTGTDAEKNVIGKISGVDGLAGVVRKSADSNKAAKVSGKTVYKDSSGKAYTRSTFGNKVEVEFKDGNWSNKTDAKGEPVKYSKGKGVTSGHGTKSEQDNSDEKEESKIICTAMNASYGFGSYRQAIWLNYSNKHLTKAHEVGYHTLFLPLVHLAYTKDNKLIRKILEHGTRRRTADLRAELKGTKRNTLGRIYRSIFEPLCYGVGKIKMAFGE